MTDHSTPSIKGYVSIFIVIYNLTFFTGLYRVIAWDFPDGADDATTQIDEPESIKQRWYRRRCWVHSRIARLRGLDQQRTIQGGVRKTDLGEEGAIESSDGTSYVLNQPERLSEEAKHDEEDDKEVIQQLTNRGPTRQIDRRRRASASASTSASQQLSIPMDKLTRQTSAATVEAVLPASGSRFEPEQDPDYPIASSSSLQLQQHPPVDRHQKPTSASSLAASIHTADLLAAHPHPGADDPSTPVSRSRAFLSSIGRAVSVVLTPITASLVVSLVIALFV